MALNIVLAYQMQPQINAIVYDQKTKERFDSH